MRWQRGNGSIIVTVTVALFAVFLLTMFTFGGYFVCIFLALGYLLMLAGFSNESCEERTVAANAGLLFGCIYAVLILLVYCPCSTSNVGMSENEEKTRILQTLET